MGNVKKPGDEGHRFLKGSVSWSDQEQSPKPWSKVHEALVEGARMKSAPKAAEAISQGGSEVLPRRRGRPPLPEGMMLDLTLRMPREILDRADALVGKASDWREFKRAMPTRSGVLRLAMTLGLEQLELRRKAGWEAPAAQLMQFHWPSPTALPEAAAEPLSSALRFAWAEKPSAQIEELKTRDERLHEMIILLAKEIDLLKVRAGSGRGIGGESAT